MADCCLHHRFNLLGSGWIPNEYGMMSQGVEGHVFKSNAMEIYNQDSPVQWFKKRINPSNLEASANIWNLIPPSYKPIDWQLDFKSGYRWSEKTWYKDIEYANCLGADVKVPWELARMQHLPICVWSYHLAKKGTKGFEDPEIYISEFKHQIYDFVANNPTRFGVNWACAMDVAIRVANWLVTYDLFKACQVDFGKEFNRVFTQSVYAHGKHISEKPGVE